MKKVDYSKAKIRVLAKENPRNKGTSAEKKFNALVKFLRSNKNATAQTVFEKTTYQKVDFLWDAKRGDVKAA